MPVKRAKKVDIVRRRDRVADLYVQGLTQPYWRDLRPPAQSLNWWPTPGYGRWN
jgi:hypothetical protein